jgi:phytoene/squalene synthetase
MTDSSLTLARWTTRAGSLHSYLIIRWLVDPDLVDDAYRAYAYFRWMDDRLDSPDASPSERTSLLHRQTEFLNEIRRGRPCLPQSPAEEWLMEIVRRDRPGHPGLRSYLDHMLAVMRFDSDRRGRTIRSEELAWYSGCLSQAVMDGLSYFVGHRLPYPTSPARLLAATGAHIVHMLRDAEEDVAVGYYNVPLEYLTAHRMSPDDVSSPAYREWTRQRAALARHCFVLGKAYIGALGSLRVRLAGYAYCARFESRLDRIERTLRRTGEPGPAEAPRRVEGVPSSRLPPPQRAGESA